MIYLQEQMQMLHALEHLRGPWLDVLWIFLNCLDTYVFYTLFVLIFFFWRLLEMGGENVRSHHGQRPCEYLF